MLEELCRGGAGWWAGGLGGRFGFLKSAENQELLGAALKRPSPWVFLVTFNLAALSTFDFTMIS